MIKLSHDIQPFIDGNILQNIRTWNDILPMQSAVITDYNLMWRSSHISLWLAGLKTMYYGYIVVSWRVVKWYVTGEWSEHPVRHLLPSSLTAQRFLASNNSQTKYFYFLSLTCSSSYYVRLRQQQNWKIGK